MLLFMGIHQAMAIKPTQIYVSQFGKIEFLYFDLRTSFELSPLSGLEMDGKGNVTALEVQVGHTIIQFDQFGVPAQPTLQGQFRIQYNHNHKIEKIKNYQNQLLLKLEYDFNGRLVKIKDGNYDTRLKLYYNYDGRLTAVADGNFNKKIRLYFNFNDDLTGIKNENLDYEYKLYYNWNCKLPLIRTT